MSRRKSRVPARLQLSRAAGFDLSKLSVKTNGLTCRRVDRSTEWGNHYVPLMDGRWWVIARAGEVAPGAKTFGTREKATEEAVRLHAMDCEAIAPRIRQHLVGVNLACWCKPGAPCHADTLLRIANEVTANE